MNENLKRHRPDIMAIGEGKALAIMPEDPMGVWVHIQEVRDLLDVKDRTIRDYEDNYLPRPKTMSVKSWMIGSPETGEQWVYDAEEVDRVIAEKDAEIAKLKEQVREERSAKVDYKISANDLSDGLKEAYEEIDHHKYKRCLDKAKRCLRKQTTTLSLRGMAKMLRSIIESRFCIPSGMPVG